MDILKAKDIASETAKLNESFSQVMNLAIQLKEESEGKQRLLDRREKEIIKVKRQRDEALGGLRQPSQMLEDNEAQASKVKAEDLKPALVLALCQRDLAMRSVKKVHEIHNLLNEWKQNDETNIGECEGDYEIIAEISQILRWHINGVESNYKKGAV